MARSTNTTITTSITTNTTFNTPQHLLVGLDGRLLRLGRGGMIVGLDGRTVRLGRGGRVGLVWEVGGTGRP